ncbi:hypothetical protein L5515_001871 [Caenorhabditis briggsae]|uniref:Uncharacterized protein n=1 Tax=Caenorhabditis briggsae TaxID=6238 RepID=A0AAE9E725_CAEBR|nr:hypothetical protein L5515_001871 [Caenorhabditis briggsae]
MFADSDNGYVDIISRTVNNRTYVIMTKHTSELAGAPHKSIEINGYINNADEDVDGIQGDYSIQRWDGVKATISCMFGYFTMVIWHAD